LAALDTRIAALSSSVRPDRGDAVVDIRDAEAEVEADDEPDDEVEDDPELPEAPAPQLGAITPPASRWSDWRST
jgi:hypothetical protein